MGWWILFGTLVWLMVSGCTQDGRDTPPTEDGGKTGKKTVEKEWVVKWKQSEADPEFLREVQVIHRTEDQGVKMLVRLKEGVKEDVWLERWSSDEGVEFIHPNQKYQVEERKGTDTATNTEKGNDYLKRIRADRAWREVRFRGRHQPVVVAVVDTGADLDHPALKPFLTQGVNLKEPSQSPEDRMGHGTHVAGVIAEVWRGWSRQGGEESNPADFVQIMPVKVMEDGSDGDVYFTSEGIREAVRRKADVIVLSQGSWTYSEAMAEAVRYAEEKGVVVIGASGNASISEDGELLHNSPIYYPAAFPTVIGVGSTDPDGKVVLTSNFGPGIDVVAPGESIRAAVVGGNYGTDSGTSFAAPQVGALASLILRRYPDFSPVQVRALIRQSAHPNGENRWDPYNGFGMIDVYAALTETPRKDIFEPNEGKKSAMPFSRDQVYNAVLDGKNDTDCYTISVPYSGTLNLSLKGADRKPEGVRVEISGEKNVRYQGKEAEQIRLSVSPGPITACLSTSQNKAWEYELENNYRQEADEYENNDHQWNAYNAKVAPGYTHFRGTLHRKRDNDWYRLQVSKPGKLSLRLDVFSPRGDPVLYLQREGSWKGKKVDGEAEGKPEEIEWKVKSGSLYVRITDYGTNPNPDPYHFMVRFQPGDRDVFEPNNTSAQARLLEEGEEGTGKFGGGSDLDWYVYFSGREEKTPIRFKVPEGAEDAVLLLYDEDLRVLEKIRLSGGRRSETRIRTLAKGMYHLRVQGGENDAKKGYRLQVGR
ncbi:subtilase family protein [Melghirimyces profundicolus]|uniref:Subtilase family protein n=2 Tax=Melghirimyces profundicolus TaxID=1242148 RepID=A0A2T6C2P1_9BACL|nr:subtilase family protein [Melghirimyces profundicolus]